MKKIVLKQFQATNGQYLVYLGNHRSVQLSSKRDLFAFIRKTNKFLTERAFEVHDMYISCWTEYQRCWFYFGSSDSNTLHFIDQNYCRQNLEGCEQTIAQCLNQADWYRGNPFPFQQLIISAGLLRKTIGILISLHSKRSQTSDKYRMKVILTRLIDIEKRIEDYRIVESLSTINNKITEHA